MWHFVEKDRDGCDDTKITADEVGCANGQSISEIVCKVCCQI